MATSEQTAAVQLFPSEAVAARIAEAKATEAEAQATSAIIHAIGPELRTIAETPGISAAIEGWGKAQEVNADIARKREAFAAADRARTIYIGAGLLVFAALFLTGLAVLFEAKMIAKDSALTVVGVVAFAWSHLARRKQ